MTQEGAIGGFILAAKVNPGDTNPTHEVKPGDRGYGKTVIKGRTIETFDVTVVAVGVPGPSGIQDILIRVSGPVIEAAGGVAQGMSGSPIYINGRNIGALALGFDGDNTLAGVTPLSTMLANAPVPETAAHAVMARLPGMPGGGPAGGEPVEPLRRPVPGKAGAPGLPGPVRTRTRLGGEGEAGVGGGHGTPALHAAAAGAPTMVAGGFQTEKSLRRLAQLLGVPILRGPMSKGSIPVRAVLARAEESKAQERDAGQEPGSAVAVALVTGDLQLGAIGTTTHVDGNRVWAFGHPFLMAGSVDYAMTNATILAVVRGPVPYKIGTIDEVVGSITQDRPAAVAGVLGRVPQLVPCHFGVTDLDQERTENVDVEVVPAMDIQEGVVPAVAYEAVTRAIDRFGPGTARVSVLLEVNPPVGNIKRTDMLYDSFDVAAAISDRVDVAFSVLADNPFEPVRVTACRVAATVTEERLTATAAGIRLASGTRVQAGRPLQVEVILKPYGASLVSVFAELIVPVDFPLGEAVLRAIPGARTGMFTNTDSEASPDSVAGLIEQFNHGPHDNDLLIQLVSYRDTADTEDAEDQANSDREGNHDEPDVVETVVRTDFVLIGEEAEISVTVVSPGNRPGRATTGPRGAAATLGQKQEKGSASQASPGVPRGRESHVAWLSEAWHTSSSKQKRTGRAEKGKADRRNA